MGDFIDVTQREGLKGFNFEPLNQAALESAIQNCLKDSRHAKSYAQNNIDVSKAVSMQTVASVQLQLLKQVQKGRFNHLRRAQNSALHMKYQDSYAKSSHA